MQSWYNFKTHKEDPAKDPTADVSVNLFSSQPTVGSVSSTLTIPFGQTQAAGTISLTNSPGTTTITAQASSYTTGQAAMTTSVIDFLPLQITLTPDSQNLNNAAKTNITAYIVANGAAVTGATVSFTSDSGGTFTAIKEVGNGYYNTIFTAASFTKTTTCTITASASKTGYLNSQATTQITVQPASTTSTSNSTTTSNPTQNSNTTSNSPSTIQFRFKDSQSNALSGVSVSSTIQPAGVETLSGTSNSTGYVIFQNVTVGNYTFSIVKAGYYQTIQHVDLKGQPVATTLTLSSNVSGSTKGDNSLPTILIVVVVIVVAVIAVVLIVKRRRSDPSEASTSSL